MLSLCDFSAAIRAQLFTCSCLEALSVSKSDHHAIMQLRAALTDLKGQPSDGLTVGLCETTDGALANAFAKCAE
jgi:hypothetical protein